MAAPTLETDGTILRITSGTSGDPVTLNDVWDWDDGGGSSGGDGDIPIDGGGTEKVSAYLTEHVADGVYQVHKGIQIGNGVTSTYFQSLGESVHFDTGYGVDVSVTATTIVLRLSRWSLATPNGQIKYIRGTNTVIDRSIIENRGGCDDIRIYGCTVQDAILSGPSGGRSGRFTIGNNTTLTNVIVTNSGNVNLDGSPSVLTLNSKNNTWGVYTYNFSVTVSSVSFVDIVTADVWVNGATGHIILIDSDDPTTILHSNAANTTIAKKTVNIHVNDKNGANLAAVTVVADSFGNIVSADAGSTFYRCIVDHTSGVFADDLAAGKWELTTAANAALAGVAGGAGTGAWVTGIAYVKLAHEFSVATDANGDIAEQTLTRKQWVGTSEALLSYAPYKFGFVKAGYQSLTLENIEIDAATVWTQELQDISSGASTGPIDQQWIR